MNIYLGVPLSSKTNKFLFFKNHYLKKKSKIYNPGQAFTTRFFWVKNNHNIMLIYSASAHNSAGLLVIPKKSLNKPFNPSRKAVLILFHFFNKPKLYSILYTE